MGLEVPMRESSGLGGNVIHRSPYVVVAAMQFDARLASMPTLFRRTQFLYEVLRDHPVIKVNQAAPQANMLHIHLPVSRECALESCLSYSALWAKRWPGPGQTAHQTFVR